MFRTIKFNHLITRVARKSQTSDVETAMMLIGFGLLDLVISVLLPNYGLDIPVDYSF
jgi:hypothetical protein